MRSGRITSTSGRARPGRATLALLVLGLLGASPAAAVAAERIVDVTLDQAQILPYPAGTDTIVVGNPIIADVTMVKGSGHLILTGRAFGETNIVFLDDKGTVLADARIDVRAAASMVVVQRGTERETYSCRLRCQPTVNLGDSHDYFAGNLRDVQARNALATGAATAPNAAGR